MFLPHGRTLIDPFPSYPFFSAQSLNQRPKEEAWNLEPRALRFGTCSYSLLEQLASRPNRHQALPETSHGIWRKESRNLASLVKSALVLGLMSY